MAVRGGKSHRCGVKQHQVAARRDDDPRLRLCRFQGAWCGVRSGDMVHISHGPVGCGQYSWAQRRNYYIGVTGVDTFVTMQFTSDFQEKDIVFGGDKKLDKIIDEIRSCSR